MATQTVKVPAQADGLVAQRVGDEIVVVDPSTNHANALSGLSAEIWEAGATGSWTGTASNAEVDRVINELLEAGLLTAPSHLTRRRALQGAGALTVVGGVMAIGLPSSASAASGTVVMTPGKHFLVVPAGPTVIAFTLVGGGGGASGDPTTNVGGAGGSITGTLTYSGPKAKIPVIVGAAGGPGNSSKSKANGGIGGGHQSGIPGNGGNGATGGGLGAFLVGHYPGGGGGGGATAIEFDAMNVVVVGGGGGGSKTGPGGNGSGTGGTRPALFNGHGGVLAGTGHVGGGGGGGGAVAGAGGTPDHPGGGGLGYFQDVRGLSITGEIYGVGADGYGAPGVGGVAMFTGPGISLG